MKNEISKEFELKYNIDLSKLEDGKSAEIFAALKARNLPQKEFNKVKQLINSQKKLVIRIKRLDKMQNIFKYWHVAHLPFALIMLIVMVIHVVVVLTLGYKWIF